MDHCLHVWWDLQRVGEDGSLCWGGWGEWGEWESLGLRAPSVAWAELGVGLPLVLNWR